MLRPTVTRPVYLGVKPHLGPKNRFLLLSESCGFVDVPSPTKWRVCRLQWLLVLASAVILGPESRGTYDHILLSQIRDSSNLEGQVPVFISPQEHIGPVIPPGTGLPLFEPAYTRDAVPMKMAHTRKTEVSDRHFSVAQAHTHVCLSHSGVASTMQSTETLCNWHDIQMSLLSSSAYFTTCSLIN
jgi:hypothetical protein